jgi:hypothetical protein
LEVRLLASTKTCYAKTCRYHQGAFTERQPFCCDLLAETFNSQSHALFFGIGHDPQEFISTNPPADITLPRTALEELSENFEDSIASLVAMRIIYGLELVQVGHDDPKSKIVPHGSAHLPDCPLFKRATIREPSELVGKCQLLQKAIFRLDFPVKLDDSPGYFCSRQQFLCVERLRKVIVGSGLQSFHHVRFLRDGGEQDDVGKEIFEVGTKALAEFYATDVWHEPIRYNQAGALQCEEVQSFTARFRRKNRELFRWEGVLHQFPGDRRIVNQQEWKWLFGAVHSFLRERSARSRTRCKPLLQYLVLVQLDVCKSDAHAHVRLAMNYNTECGETCIFMEDMQSDFRALRNGVCHIEVAADEAKL